MSGGGPPDWDALYRDAAGGLFGEEPNLFLRMALTRPDIQPRSALSIADGDGRNGTWLAGQGMEVTAIDLSPEAARRARMRDEKAGVTVDRIVADLRDWQPAAGQAWDLVALIHLHGPPALRRRAVETAAAAAAPRGWLVMEAFGLHGWDGGRPGSTTPENRYSAAELRAWAGRLDIVELTEGRIRLDEGARHAGMASIIRLIARSPA